MSGISYEIYDRYRNKYKHTFDYDFTKSKYEEYSRLTVKEFTEKLKNPKLLGEIGHLCCFVLWVKNLEQDEYRQNFGDYGLIHLLFHCLESDHEAEKLGKYIYESFKIDIKLA